MLPPVRVKGISEPIQIYRLTGLRPAPETVRGSSGLRSPLVMIDQKIKALFNRGQNKAKEELPPLSKDTLNHIRKLAAKSARAQGLPEDQSQKIAIALVGLLALV